MTDIAFYITPGGQNSAGLAERLTKEQYARGINVAVKGQLPSTRMGVRVIPMSGDGAELFATLNVQGAIRYNPSEGQGAITQGKDESTFLVAVGGRKFQVGLEGNPSDCKATCADVSNGLVSDPRLHLVYWSQWENYALAGDGMSNTWIWSGVDPAFLSTGYNNVDKEASMVPNGATVMAYIHGVGCSVVNSKALLVSDQIYSRDQQTAKDILTYRDQTYFATGTYFAPPTRMGAINAAFPLPIMDTAHGQGDLLLHCQRGVFSVNLNIFPRSLWKNAPMVKITHLGSGATGPYAVAVFQGDQLFRSRVGVQTLRSARASATRPGAPQKSIAQTVDDFLKADSPEYLRFASVETWEQQSRGFVTVSPIVQSRFRWHRGFIVANFDPVPVADTPAAWEGLWTLPPEIGGVVQFISGDFDGQDRMFAICRAADGRNRLIEFRPELIDDILEDGTRSRIRSQLVTRRDDQQDPVRKKTWGDGTMFLKNVRGRVDWGVWVRSHGNRKWFLWRSGYVNNCGDCAAECDICEPPPWDGEVPLGSLDALVSQCFKKTARNIQFLIRWAGSCSVESLSFNADKGDPDDGKFDQNGLKVEVKECPRDFVEYSDYEYLETSAADSWLRETQPKQ